jgi:hypothetical protein
MSMSGSSVQPKARKHSITSSQSSTDDSGARTAPLNFKVPQEFRREFKTYAAQHNKKLNQLLYEAFDALKARHAE